jgi:two-component system phosphate regulon sensor histidine kinase PhoR
VIPFEKLLLKGPIVRAFAAVACLLIALLAWAGYIAVREWQSTVLLLANRQAAAAADRSFAQLTRDMQAVQRQVLQSPALDAFTSIEPPFDPSYEAANLVASALARYSYPESFFLWSGEPAATPPAFFYRRDRRPPWSANSGDPGRFPVVIEERASISASVISLIQHDAAPGRPFVVLETTLNGTPYQIVARLLYKDPFRQKINAIFGFMVNLTWAREHYYSALLQQTLPTNNASREVGISILDDQGQPVAEAGAVGAGRGATPSVRTFRPLFFNPLLVAAEPPSAQQRRLWKIDAVTREDSSLLGAATAANRMLILQIAAAAMLAGGILLSLRATRSGLRLAELRSNFVANVTHEFKTPIATIRAAGETLVAGRLDGAAARRDYASYIVEESRRLTHLVDNLLAFSRLTDAVEMKHTVEPVALAEVVKQTIDRFSLQLSGGEFRVEAWVPASLPPVAGDPSAIALMLDNLVDNAIRHSRAEHVLEIRARAESDTLILEVADRGGGIPPDEIARVTRRFYRGRHAGQGGTGLGLAIAARIAADHGGALTVSSEPGVGTTVRVRLPAMAGHEAHALRAQGEET